MISRDDQPDTPDWTPHVGNLCAGCLGTANLCHVLHSVDGRPCCNLCSHGAVLPEVRLWEGDQV